MPDTVILQAAVDAELDRALSRLAAAHGMGKDALVADVLRDFVAAEPELAEFLGRGVADAEAGRLIAHAEVGKRIRRVLDSDA